MSLFVLFLLFLSFPLSENCKSAEEWSGRTIYQVVVDRFSKDTHSVEWCNDLDDYCGGTFRGIQNNLNHILEMGFDAIWISPVTETAPNGYHGYWPTNLYKINPFFSSSRSSAQAAKDLKSLIKECHKRNIWVMIDVVPNHMGGPTLVKSNRIDLNHFFPFNSSEFFNDEVCGTKLCNLTNNDCLVKNSAYKINPLCMENDFLSVEMCRQATGLIDLNQNRKEVSNELIKWIQWIIKVYNFDGIRIDSGKHMPISFLKQFSSSTTCFTMAEVFDDANPCFLAKYQNMRAFDSLHSYPMAFTLRNVFGKGESFESLKTQIVKYKEANFLHSKLLGTFIDNHDLDRFHTINSEAYSIKNAIAYVLLSDGIPIMYYGTEYAFNGSYSGASNRKPLWHSKFFKTQKSTSLYSFISNLNRFRKMYQIWRFEQVELMSSNKMYVFKRGNALVVLTNSKDLIAGEVTHGSLKFGEVYCDYMSQLRSRYCTAVGYGGRLNIQTKGQPRILIPYTHKTKT